MESLRKQEKRGILKERVAAVLLSLFLSVHSAPVSDCERLVKPITISKEDMLARWIYIGGSSDLPGSRSLGRLMTNVWIDIIATGERNILNLIQTQRIYGECSSLSYNVTFENSTMIIEQPFYLKEVYLTTEPDYLVAYEQIVSGKDTFTSLLLFSRKQSVSANILETLGRQAECLSLPSPIVMDPNSEMCPDNIPPSEGLSALNSLLEKKIGHQVARVLDTLFDLLVN